MMFERFTEDARALVAGAQEHARRLGHRYIGCEHLLLALTATETPAGAVLREHGITPGRVEREIARLAGLGAGGGLGPGAEPGAGPGPGIGAGLFGDLDREALSAIGIDLDAVRARIESSFGPEALARASHTIHRRPGPSRLSPRRALPHALARRWRRRHPRDARPFAAAAPAAGPRTAQAGRCQPAGAARFGHLPLTARAKKSLANSLREAQARHDGHIGAEHLALGLLGMSSGMVPPILAALGTSGPALRAAIQRRYRRAG